MDPRFAKKSAIWDDFPEAEEKSVSDEDPRSDEDIGSESEEDGESVGSGSGDESIDDTNKKEKKAKRDRKKDKDKSNLRKEAMQFREKLSKRGVMYLSRVPRNMNPSTVRTYLEQYGEITRIYLAEDETKSSRSSGVPRGPGHKSNFKEGWIEYANKKNAKNVAASLNNTPISNKKRSKYHDEMWNLKYLKKFQWDYLTEKLAYERRIREAKIKASMLQSKKNNQEFAELVERGKSSKFAKERRDNEGKKRKYVDGDGGDGGDGNSQKLKRKFKQTQALNLGNGEQSSLINKNVLNKVWKNKKE
jgi:ESF2/ABP1 family protein